MSNQQIAVFAGGCFWCTEPVFSQLKGVSKVVSGYIGGHTLNPSYKEICNGDTGHAEGIQINFDADQVSFETLLEVFFMSHDPTTLNRQGNDVGTQYRSAVFCQNTAQRDAVIKKISDLNAAHIFSAPIVTQISGADTFYPAEDYHQYYFEKNPSQPYCLAVAAPKKEKVRTKYSDLIKDLSQDA
ncbi:peptide-methionine (S)-S-oxide reductase MsrA [Methylotenera versatilis]|uniref:peptide-methionine (S)-S-oxide reductase MsrA n=1 Tax=Methylotenera versatilis TaxID=1055487 RepID=UPI000646DACE|nr:peptide-methionine (S)-S-oxide reductase MsrA [Methylotenera versatilis]